LKRDGRRIDGGNKLGYIQPISVLGRRIICDEFSSRLVGGRQPIQSADGPDMRRIRCLLTYTGGLRGRPEYGLLNRSSFRKQGLRSRAEALSAVMHAEGDQVFGPMR
jgi:hypothetical protein